MKNNNAISAVSLDTCHLIKNTKSPFILVLNKGQNLIETLLQCSQIVNIPSAIISGIGALEDPILGWYDFATRKHMPRQFLGVYELIGISGNITQCDGAYFAHIHVCVSKLGDESCSAISGHLIASSIGILAEINFTPFEYPVLREYNSELNGNVIKV